MATLLGFLDDIFDIRWRYKLPIPVLASIPMLLVYSAEEGNTHIVLPRFLRGAFGGSVLHLGEGDSVIRAIVHLTLNELRRATLLCIYVDALYFLHKLHQHLSRDKWDRGIASRHNSLIRSSQRPSISSLTVRY